MRSWGRRGSVTLQIIPVLRLLSPVVSHTTRLVWPFQGARTFEPNVQKIFLSFNVSLENASQLPVRITISILESSSKVITYLFYWLVITIQDHQNTFICIWVLTKICYAMLWKFAMGLYITGIIIYYIIDETCICDLRYIKKRERACIQCWTAIFADSAEKDP